MVDLERPDLQAFPKLGALRGAVASVRQNEAIFIPTRLGVEAERKASTGTGGITSRGWRAKVGLWSFETWGVRADLAQGVQGIKRALRVWWHGGHYAVDGEELLLQPRGDDASAASLGAWGAGPYDRDAEESVDQLQFGEPKRPSRPAWLQQLL